MRAAITALIAVLTASAVGAYAGNDSHPSSGPGLWSKLIIDGRESDVFVPDCAQKGTPMIVSLHAWGTTKELQESTNDKFSFPGYVGPEKCFVVVYPEGKLRTTEFPLGGFSWNAGGCCPLDNSQHINDVDYLGKVITQTAIQFDASADTVFAVGISNGGMMANRLACSDNRIKALVALSGPLVNGSVDHNLETFTCSRRLPVLHFHGDKDPIVPFDGCNRSHGGRVCQSMMQILGNKVADSLTSVPEYIAGWRARNGLPKDEPGAITFQNGTTNCTSWGEAASNVTLCIVGGQGHAWPAHCSILNKIVPGCSCTHSIHASQHALAFLQRYVPAVKLVV